MDKEELFIATVAILIALIAAVAAVTCVIGSKQIEYNMQKLQYDMQYEAILKRIELEKCGEYLENE